MNSTEKVINGKKYGLISFIPLLIFLALYLGGGIIYSFMGVDAPFSQIPRHGALSQFNLA